MKIKIGMMLSGLLISTQLFAFSCFFTIAKDSCWTNYDVKVTVIDTRTNKTILGLTIPKGKTWARDSFTCTPGQQFIYRATYQPIFWQSEIGKIYRSIRYWSLPAQIKPKESAWNLPVCFPADFAAIPLPPDAQGNCQCNLKNIPPPAPQ